MVQLSQSINSDAKSNAHSSTISSTNQKTNSKLHDGAWDTTTSTSSATPTVADKAASKAPKNAGNKHLEAQQPAEEEKAATDDARKWTNDELSKAEPVDRTALQTGSMTKSKTKYIEEIGNEREGEKLGEIIRENAEAAAVGSLDAGRQPEKTEEESRASLSQALKAEQQNKDEVDEIINTRVVDIEDLAGKSDAEMRSDLEKLKKEERAADANK